MLPCHGIPMPLEGVLDYTFTILGYASLRDLLFTTVAYGHIQECGPLTLPNNPSILIGGPHKSRGVRRNRYASRDLHAYMMILV